MIQIFVKGIDGITFTIDVRPTERVSKVFLKIEKKKSIPAPRTRLIYGGKQLAWGKRISDYGIVKNSTLHLNLRLAPEIYVKINNRWLVKKRYFEGQKMVFPVNFYYYLIKTNGEPVRDLDEIKKILTKHLKIDQSRITLLNSKDLTRSIENDEEWMRDIHISIS